MARRRQESDPQLLAVCRLEGDEVHVLLVREGSGTGHATVDRFRCRESELEDRLLEASCSRVLAILPASSTLVRTVHVPASSSALQVESAIRLEAESRLLGATPRHRSGIRLVGIETATPTGLVVAWPDTLEPGLESLGHDLDVHWIPEVACLALLAGDTPKGLTAFLDADGSTSAVVPSPKGPVYRVTRGRPGATPTERLRPLVVESLLAEGVDAGEIERVVSDLLSNLPSIEGGMVASPDADDRIEGLVDRPLPDRHDPDGASMRLLVAALAIHSGADAEIASLRRHEFVEQPGFLGAMTSRLSDGRTAVAVTTLALLVLVLSPVAFAGLRLMVMNGKVADLDALERRVERVESLGMVYRELDRQAWSVTKLLGDISNLMPEQIELVSISLTHGEPVSLSGFAKRDGDMTGTDVVFEFNRRLRESGLFANAGPMPSIDPPDSKGYSEFTISAELDDPLRQVRPKAEDDYAVLTFSDRRYGPVDEDGYLIVDPEAREARIAELIDRGIDLERSIQLASAGTSSSGSAERAGTPSRSTSSSRTSGRPSRGTASAGASAPSDPEAPSEARANADEGTRESSGSRASSTRSRGSSGSSGPASRGDIRSRVIEIPEPLTPEEVAQLSNAEAKARLTKVASARSAPNATDEQKAALKSEWEMLLQRIRETMP
ncbi:MAG: PilN domain-containing protein [Planctomycetota bacterium]|nr:PilN domain-containing protein [Planctomycetota bacterium]